MRRLACQKSVGMRNNSHEQSMLTFLKLAQLVLYVALLALLGQGLLYLLAGARRESNVFYKLLQVIAKPFTLPMRRILPRAVEDRHVSLVTCLLLLVAYAVVTFEKIDLCIQLEMAGCR